ncbi:MOSC domain-containing protein [Chitinimonas prasina]|uniref:MOSC domain-containing protein n=1 Tax=Chitinimonas prasina TaxID=1434937 RepID=A0ABQ5YJS0_9NEIS|nr:MOSC domain-containing protein [Chitinimonas prasina]GLR14698.1 MOSC domain-containing protein [Chitinimonas prasina]
MQGEVLAVCRHPEHGFSKPCTAQITLLAGLGVEGDAHMGTTVKHRSRVRQNPDQPNLRQVHLLAAELLDELQQQGFAVAPGALGENLTTRGLDLIHLPRGTVLHLGEQAEVEITGLRNPCTQIEAFQPGLLAAVLGRDEAGNLVRKAGIMGIVRAGGVVRPGDTIRLTLPPLPYHKLERV